MGFAKRDGPLPRLGERYTLVDRLGRGGMGVVYRARDERLGRHVAIKLVPPTEVDDEMALARLMREARAIAALEHPGIVQVFDVGHHPEGGLYVVMELVRGTTLRSRMQAGLSTDESLSILREVAETLDAAHAHGFVHRDVKPDNIMIRDDGRITLLDFGLVKSVELASLDTQSGSEPPRSDLTSKGAIVGTFDYLAPEQTDGEAGPPADQFALAITAYQLLTGALPWPAPTPLAAITRRLSAPPVAASDAQPKLPKPVDAVFVRALAREATARYPSVGEFVKALEQAFGYGDEQPTPITSFFDRQRAIWAALLVSLLGLGAMAVVSLDAWTGSDAPGGADEAPAGPSAVAAASPPAGVGRAELACPILAAEGVEAPTAWLGAAASDLACRWGHWWLGATVGTTLVPAELLDVPPLPADGLSNDPFAEPGLREATLEAARNRAKMYIDGQVAARRSGFEVQLILNAFDGAEMARATGEAPALHVAVHRAMSVLFESPAHPPSRPVAAPTAEWTGLKTHEGGIALEALHGALVASFETDTACAAVREDAPHALVFADLVHECAHARSPGPVLADSELDRTSPSRFVATAARHARSHADADLRALATELATLRQGEDSAEGRASIALAEARILMLLPAEGRGTLVLRAAVAESPRSWPLREQLLTSAGRSGYLGVVRSAAAWTPASADVWAHFVVARDLDMPTRHRLASRAYELAPTAPNHGAMRAKLLLAAGQNEGAREIATRFAERASGADLDLGAEYIAALVDMSDARFDRALQRLRKALLQVETFGWFRNNDVSALRSVWRLSKLLGRSREVADDVAKHLVLSGDVTLVAENRFHIGPLVQLCMDASPNVALRCLDHIGKARRGGNARQLDNSNAYLAGAKQYVDGQDRAAVELWRPLLEDPFHAKLLAVDAFDRVGEHELAERLDQLREESRRLHGEDLSTPRIAARAETRGNVDRARRHAQRVIDAWATADAPVPAVDEMRALLSRLQ